MRKPVEKETVRCPECSLLLVPDLVWPTKFPDGTKVKLGIVPNHTNTIAFPYLTCDFVGLVVKVVGP